MLSFLKEQSGGDPGQQEGQPQDGQVQQEYLTVSARGKQNKKSTIALGVLFAAGLVGLWVMIQKSTPEGVDASEANIEGIKIESAISRITGVKTEMYNRMDEIVDKFYQFSQVDQIEVDELAKNPFQNKPFEAEAAPQDSDVSSELMRQQMMRDQTSHMQLLSIMRSKQGNCCMINDQLLYEGDTIENFKVVRIGGKEVQLSGGGMTVMLNLDE